MEQRDAQLVDRVGAVTRDALDVFPVDLDLRGQLAAVLHGALQEAPADVEPQGQRVDVRVPSREREDLDRGLLDEACDRGRQVVDSLTTELRFASSPLPASLPNRKSASPLSAQ